MRRHAGRLTRTASAAVPLALALALLSGCGSDSGEESADADGRESAALDDPAPTGEAAGADDPGGTGGAEDGGDPSPDPDAASGSGTDDAGPGQEIEFTEQEEKYLEDKVPEGADPAALLEVGEEACQRIGYLDRHDRGGAVEALRDGEIPGAEEAVEHLCPEYRPLLKEARG